MTTLSQENTLYANRKPLVVKKVGTNLLPFILVCGYYLAEQFLPIMNYISIVYIDIIAVCLILLIVITGNYSKRTLLFVVPFVPLLLMMIIRDINLTQIGLKNLILLIYSITLFILPLIISIFVLNNNYRKTARVLLLFSVLFLLITSWTSIYGLTTDPTASKVLATGGIDESQLMKYYQNNIGGFHIAYLLPIIIPMIIAAHRHRKITLIVLLIVIGPMVYFVYKTQYVTALILLLISLSSYLLAYNYSFRKFLIIFFIIIFVGMFARSGISHVLLVTANHSSYTVSERLIAISDAMMGQQSTADAYVGRVNVYQHDINAFISSPIIGVVAFGGRSSGHSFILDILALYGIVGAVGLVLFYRQIYKYFYRPFRAEAYYGFMLWSLGLSIILAILNPTGSVLAIGLLVPLAAFILKDDVYCAPSNEARTRVILKT